jgi:hypothetical protein
MVAGVEREAIARERRRGQAIEHLAFEREREAALREQLEELITEQHGSQVDDSAFAGMPPEDVKVVREALVGRDEGAEVDEVEAALTDWPEETEDEVDDVEAEIARLEGELAECRRRQHAFERYLEALGS